MSTGLPPKRVFTNQAHSSRSSSFTASSTSLISDDLTTRLQNVGSRVRKSVTEGYITDRSDSAQSSGRAFNRTTSQPHTSFSGYPIFQSSFDTLRAVYAHPNITGIPDGSSVLKRPRAGAMIDEEVPGELDDDQEMEKGGVQSDNELKAAMTSENAAVLRPMKPLRRTARPFRQTQSLPAAVFGSSLVSGTQKGAGFFTKGSCHEEEDDWSTANFPDSQGQIRN